MSFNVLFLTNFDEASHQAIPAADGRELPVDVDTICIHGDTPNAVAHARAVREALLAAGVRIEAPA